MVAKAGPGWVLAPSLIDLAAEFDKLWPHRDHASDGSIGDAAHQADPTSDHDPSRVGVPATDPAVVDALDVDTDLYPGAGFGGMQAAADEIIRSRDPRVGYLIFNHRMCRSYVKPGIPPWSWAPYTGSDPHTSHLHVSIVKTPAGRTAGPWSLTTSQEPLDMALPSFLGKSDRPNDPDVWLIEGNYASRWLVPSPAALDWLRAVDTAMPATGKLLVDHGTHTVPAVVLAAIPAR